jgi:hypothetical protein
MSNTDDLEAKAREFLQARNLIALVPAEENEQSRLLITMLAAFARSLAQPPSSEEDGHPGYRAVLIAALKMETPDIQRLIKDCSMVVPKDPAPTVDVDGLATELWAMAQGLQPISDACDRMARHLRKTLFTPFQP